MRNLPFEGDPIHSVLSGEFIMLDSRPTQQLTSTSALFTQRNPTAIRSMKFRRASEAQILSIFYALTFEQRLARFGAPSSDWAIQSWRSKIDRAYYLPVIWEQGRELVGLVELFGSERTCWKRPELALALGPASDTLRVHQ